MSAAHLPRFPFFSAAQRAALLSCLVHGAALFVLAPVALQTWQVLPAQPAKRLAVQLLDAVTQPTVTPAPRAVMKPVAPVAPSSRPSSSKTRLLSAMQPVPGAPPLLASPEPVSAPVPAAAPDPAVARNPAATQTALAAATAAAEANPSAAPSAPTQPARYQGGYLHNPRPAYPASARRRGSEGLVLLGVNVNAQGYPEEIVLKKSSGDASLDAAARQAVQGWRFMAARQGERAISSWLEVPLRFRLEDDEG